MAQKEKTGNIKRIVVVLINFCANHFSFFLVENSSNLPPIQDDREEFQLGR